MVVEIFVVHDTALKHIISNELRLVQEWQREVADGLEMQRRSM